jgi:hypothetical protein
MRLSIRLTFPGLEEDSQPKFGLVCLHGQAVKL